MSGPVRAMIERASKYPDRARCSAAGVVRVRADPVDRRRPGQRRHQVVSHDRPVRTPRPSDLDVGPECGCRHGAAPEHRVSVPARPLLLADGRHRQSRLVHPAAALGHDRVRSGLRCVPPRPMARLERSRGARRRVRLRLQPLRPVVSRSTVDHPRTVGGPALDGPAGSEGRAHPILEAGRPVRGDRCAGRVGECDVVGPRRPRPGDLADHRRRLTACGARRCCPSRSEDRGAVGAGVGVVDRRAAGTGNVRHPHSAIHRDLRVGRRREHARRDHQRAGLLVALRR